eukprot:2154010-Rhodomonas_salina.6
MPRPSPRIRRSGSESSSSLVSNCSPIDAFPSGPSSHPGARARVSACKHRDSDTQMHRRVTRSIATSIATPPTSPQTSTHHHIHQHVVDQDQHVGRRSGSARRRLTCVAQGDGVAGDARWSAALRLHREGHRRIDLTSEMPTLITEPVKSGVCGVGVNPAPLDASVTRGM